MKNFRWLRDSLSMLLVLGALVLLFGSLSEHFLSGPTLITLANRIPALAVIAVGMTFVIIVGGIDLSVGSLLALAGAVLGVALVDRQWPLWLAGLACLAVGAVVGSLNGLISVRLGIPSFIVTLLIVIAGQLVLSRTVFGRYLIAIGTNESAVRLTGINPRWPKIAVFSLTGLLTGLGAVFATSRLGSSDPNAGVGLELAAIAAVVIGGTSLMGGRGSVINSFLGVLIIATLEAGLAQVGATEPAKRVITGAVIILAVVLDAWRRPPAASSLPWWRRGVHYFTTNRS